MQKNKGKSYYATMVSLFNLFIILLSLFAFPVVAEDIEVPFFNPTLVTEESDPAVYGSDFTLTAIITDEDTVLDVELYLINSDTYFTFAPTGNTNEYSVTLDTATDLGTSPALGQYDYAIFATDDTGNTGEFDGEFQLVGDTEAPSVIDETDPAFSSDGVEYSDDITLSPIATDNAKIDTISVEIYATGSPATPIYEATYDAETIEESSAVYRILLNTATDLGELGQYDYIITVTDPSGFTDSTSGSFIVVDTTAPEVVVTGANPDTLECGTEYVDQGATATDNYDDVVTASTSGTINPSIVGSQHLTYTSTDSHGNTGSELRSVTVQDTLGPVITVDPTSVTVELGTSYTDTDATAKDACEAESSVIGTGTVDISVEDSYILTYSTSDSLGNSATTQTRTVNVVDSVDPTIILSGVSSPVDYGTSLTIHADISDLSGIDDSTVTLTIEDVNENPVVFGASTIMNPIGNEVYEISFDLITPFDLGGYTYTVTASDSAQTPNQGAASGSFTIEDLSAPEMSDAGFDYDSYCIDDAITAFASVSDNYEGTDVDRVYVNIASSAGVAVDYDLSISSSTSYTHERVFDAATELNGYDDYLYSFYAEDAAGNSVGPEFEDSFTVRDCTAPEISALAANDAEFSSEDVTVTATVIDSESVVSTVTLSVVAPDGSTLVDEEEMDISLNPDEYQYTIEAESLTLVGTYTVTVTAINENEEPFQSSTTFEVEDTIAPTVSDEGTAPGSPIAYGEDMTISAIASDTAGIASVTVDVFAASDATTPVYSATVPQDEFNDNIYITDAFNTATTLGETGEYSYTLTATDNNGLVSTADGSFIVSDQNSPTVDDAGTNPTSPISYEADMTISATAADDVEVASVTVEVFATSDLTTPMYEADLSQDEFNDAVYTTDAFNTATALGETGEYSYTLTATDSSGLTDTDSGSFTVEDTTKPIITLVGDNPQHVDLGGTYVEFGATATDSHDGDLTDSIVIGGDVVDANTEGTYEVTYDVSDSEANAADTVTRTVVVSDTTVPTVSDASISATRVNQGDVVSFSVDAADDVAVDSVTILINGLVANEPMSSTDGITYTYDFDTTDVALGTYSYVITVTDDSGNSVQTETASFTITYISAIDVSIHADKTSGQEDLDVSFSSIVVGGVSPLTYSWDFGDDESSANKNIRHVYEDAGTYTATLTVFDQYGNSGSASLTITVSEEETSNDPQNNIYISSLSLPDGIVEAADALEVSVKVENIGEDRLNDVSLTVSIPELGIWYRTVGKNIRSEADTTFTASLDLPSDIAPGVYDVRIEVSNDDFQRIKYRDVEIE